VFRVAASVEVADVVRAVGAEYRSRHGVSRAQRHALWSIEHCRTSVLGGHLERCGACGWERPAYNSCRNRHCPKCQSLAKERWLEERRRELLPVGYFHLVFTLPASLRALAMWNQREVYGLLLSSAGRSILAIGRDPRFVGAKLGVLAILHTWTQRLEYHPHVHCVVPGGGLSEGGHWISARRRYLAPIRVLSRLFRGKVVSGLRRLYESGRLELRGASASLQSRAAFDACLDGLQASNWVVYCKPPFGRPATVLGYLARYTHRVAISNERVLSFHGERVVIGYRERTSGRARRVSLSAEEFIRRLLLHVLPQGFVRVRTYGLLANRDRRATLETCRTALGERRREPLPNITTEELLARILRRDPSRYPTCGVAALARHSVVPERGDCRDSPCS
jgi:hypothetical protein